MTNEELTVVATLARELKESRECIAKVSDERFKTQLAVEAKERDLLVKNDELRRVGEREASALKANEDLKARCSEMMSERDEARSKLRKVVVVLNDIWLDYGCIKFKSKAGRERAKHMAAKIKAFADEQKFTMVQDESGKWGVK